MEQLNAIEKFNSRDPEHELTGFGPWCLHSTHSWWINLGFSSLLFLKAVMTLNYAPFPLFTAVINIVTCPTGWHDCALLSNLWH